MACRHCLYPIRSEYGAPGGVFKVSYIGSIGGGLWVCAGLRFGLRIGVRQRIYRAEVAHLGDVGHSIGDDIEVVLLVSGRVVFAIFAKCVVHHRGVKGDTINGRFAARSNHAAAYAVSFEQLACDAQALNGILIS